MTENPQQPYGAQGPGGQPPYGAAQQQPYSAGGQQGSKYGTAAYNAGAFEQDVAEPKKWGLLKTLTLVSFGLYLVSGILSFFSLDEDTIRAEVQAQLEAQGQAVTPEMVDQVVSAGLVGGMVVAVANLVLSIILYLVVFLGLRKSGNWARILGTVLAALGALFTVWGLTGIGTIMSAAPVTGIVTLVLSVALVAVNTWWIVTAFSQDVNAYMRARTGR